MGQLGQVRVVSGFDDTEDQFLASNVLVAVVIEMCQVIISKTAVGLLAWVENGVLE